MSVPYERITVAPLVLLSVLDHYERTHTPEGKRCVGVVLGDASSPVLRVTNSFALPFEEDDKNSDVWFLDHNYIENMNNMFKKINAKEKLVGWYHSGPKLKASDLKINELFKKYTGNNPLLLIVDVKQEGVGLPTDAYFAVEQVKDDGTSTEKTFVHLPSTIEAEEAEEIGVEHLLRDTRDQAAGGLSIRLTNQLKSLQGLQRKLGDIVAYLNKVTNKELPVNHVILGKLQDVFNLLPNLGQPNEDELNLRNNEVVKHNNNLQKALTVKTNDELMVIYIANLVRAIISFDDLIENKIQNKKLQEKKNKDYEADHPSKTKEEEPVAAS
ncbi:RPN8 (YOR261C) [Zygosaccharomyces parabailii]|uniref:26S proteasome regulatory subunit RPN8 n=1 Tax=Zygosaccharomyces bailii (strain CLIB 213 / ATCC 58445 / CBS 680 / BCRC 21525 / NBRC 1098 / NCYC 1416 / NRRL Y-2227) TaxID=1333698 RepID=A0A8J2T482_ZYGB2|nr:RPN8 (YOR261C) [Zygosaccharomyces parabailii]AQZ17808.1 RPN8 (YOR261C) [Zygosaccharomyces parabailii]CDF88613.1 BN860_14334g1_1 [Zygosaccharomyces bailii CLIB 213]CDH14510.1 probable 26S proteasome regulatory subunit RPN8 [Zygosaccharomyces bailii ISA1307]SJM82428.1 probable 26S proteasome regulatory subunit RPN8 [Zygosaccharomyces bailii]